MVTMKFSSQRTQTDAAFWKISRKATIVCGESGSEQTRERIPERGNCEATKSAQHVVSKATPEVFLCTIIAAHREVRN
jgi:hypothetical protein